MPREWTEAEEGSGWYALEADEGCTKGVRVRECSDGLILMAHDIKVNEMVTFDMDELLSLIEFAMLKGVICGADLRQLEVKV